MEHQGTGPQTGRQRGRRVGDRGIGGGDDHEPGIAARVGDRRPPRVETRRRGDDRWRVGRPAGDGRRPPAARTQRQRNGGTGASGTDKGERVVHVVLHENLFVPAPGGAGLLGQAQP